MIDAQVSQAMREVELAGLANPASQHSAGRAARQKIEAAKESILRSLGASVDGMSAAEIIITSGGTEANNLALHAFTHQRPGLVIVGSMEHPSLLAAAELSALCLNPVRQLPARRDGQYDLDVLAKWLEEIYNGSDSSSKQVAFVSLMLANNETGVMNDLGAIAQLCRAYRVPVHCDAVQGLGKVDLNMAQLGIAALTINAHKLHGPVGVGGLILASHLEPRPVVVGGGQQLGWRAGTEPVALTVGLARSVELADLARQAEVYAETARLRDLFESTVLGQLDFVRINGSANLRLPQTSNLAFVGLDRQALQMALDLEGLACSSGAACSSGSSRPSTTLVAMGLDEEVVAGSLRFSLSRFTTGPEVRQAAEIVTRVARRLRK